jgi:hypothetical protein
MNDDGILSTPFRFLTMNSTLGETVSFIVPVGCVAFLYAIVGVCDTITSIDTPASIDISVAGIPLSHEVFPESSPFLYEYGPGSLPVYEGEDISVTFNQGDGSAGATAIAWGTLSANRAYIL